MQPRYRIVREVLDSQDRGLVSRWAENELSIGDRAAIESRLNQIELNETENPNWIKYYKTLRMWEIRLSTGGKALRILCDKEKDGSDVILLIGCIKRGQIKTSEEAKAAERRDRYRKGKLNVRDYPLPQRPHRDVGKPER